MAKKPDRQTIPRGPRTVATNRKARHEYHIEETYEAGIALSGTEIKSVRLGRVSLQDGFVLVRNDEAMLMNVHIAHYEMGNRFNHDETRPRKLLLHRGEIERLIGKSQQKGLTLIPSRIYFKGPKAKVELALAKGKEGRDRRREIANRDVQRDVEREFKGRYRS